ncbi:hypothetical protein RI103_21555 [Paraburkholderia sp. FT54]|uniref:hypothetical protein n=1 Tax=Paraburkholderia sp. FT54 TaxID=3074437 RepID=UPI00287791DE|nr:hypothetical protein [Paraburkholderia sp. FT54]WNC94373.1 hypothetical protein RI103_21555 [Paraburkholderia sp. FT54]
MSESWRSAPPRPDSSIAAPGFRPESIWPFQMGLPALDAFPRKIWARLGARRVPVFSKRLRSDARRDATSHNPALLSELADVCLHQLALILRIRPAKEPPPSRRLLW